MGNSKSIPQNRLNSKDVTSDDYDIDVLESLKTEALHKLSLELLNKSYYVFLNKTEPDDDFDSYQKIEAKDVPNIIHRMRSNDYEALIYFELILQELCRRKTPLKGSGYLCVEY